MLENTPLSTSPPPDTLLALKQVTAITSASRSSIYAWIARGLFPKPIRIGPRRTAWHASEVKAWMAERPRA